MRRLALFLFLSLAGCGGTTPAEMCSKFCLDTAGCAAGTGWSADGCQNGCTKRAQTEPAYLTWIECVYKSSGTCMTGYPECGATPN
jgi:hypothetical protein